MNQVANLFDQGLRAEREGRFEEALKYYRAVAKADPTHRSAFNNMGVLYAKHRRPDLALKFFTRALELGEDAVVYFNLGSESFRVGNLDDCEKFLKKALHFEKRLVRAHLLLAYVYGKQARHDKAEIYFSNTLKIEPANRPAALGFSVSLMERGKFEQALAVIDKYLQRAGTDESFMNLRGELLLKLGRNQESLAEFSRLTKTPRYASFTEHVRAARAQADTTYGEMFEEIDAKIRDRSDKVRSRIEKRKARLASLAAKSPNPADKQEAVRVTADEVKEEARDMLDLSFLHLFKGDSDQALKLLFQARKLAEKKPL